MKFEVSRTSIVNEDLKPCDEAKKEYFICKRSGSDRLHSLWVVEINSIDDLVDFYEKYGQIIISKSFYECDDVKYEIEIYDEAREW